MRLLLLFLVALLSTVHAEEKPFPKPIEPLAEATSEETGKRIQELIQKLGDDDYGIRVEAENQLRKLGASSLKQLKEMQDSKDIQVRASVEKLLTEMRTEDWEGYYYYSLDSFDAAVEKNTKRVRFWCSVKRNDAGTFRGAMDEGDTSLGTSKISGLVECKSGEFNFDKTYDSQSIEWRYEGKWNAEKQRIEGTYGPGSGGFILFPRKLTEEERKRYDAPQNA